MMNNRLYAERGTPHQLLEQFISIYNLLSDPNRNHFGWEIFRLADLLKAHIKVARTNKRKRIGNRIIFDLCRQLHSVLYWLVTGAEIRQLEAYYRLSKNAVQIEIVHMLQAITYGLDQFL